MGPGSFGQPLYMGQQVQEVGVEQGSLLGYPQSWNARPNGQPFDPSMIMNQAGSYQGGIPPQGLNSNDGGIMATNNLLPPLLPPQRLPFSNWFYPFSADNTQPLISLPASVHPIDAKMNVEKLMKMAGAVRTGGKGSMRRKKKAVHKTTTTDDKRLQSTLKRIGVNTIPSIEEVNIFKDETVIQFLNPKVQASIGANTWVVSGSPQTKKLQDILPGILNQLGPDNLDNLRKLAEQFQKQAPGEGAAAKSALEDDDEVPELVAGETFEAAAEEGQKP
ncbi:hypothetical protein E3N88_31775 [Mikania micrantha]|uniref:Nascent polypeptide-associated complex subunit beta n=1 Tax=Mikania micrantha TaxID=192012 RepID=A0A5N6M760_9ASTR|nr:hypothetical protein E3N88_31775 [Mikania micrantha]